MTPAQTETAADVVVDEGAAGNGRRYVFSGDWRHETAEAMSAKLKRLGKPAGGQSEFDFSGITAMDTAGAWIIRRFMNGTADEVRFAGSDRYAELILALPKQLRSPEGRRHEHHSSSGCLRL